MTMKSIGNKKLVGVMSLVIVAALFSLLVGFTVTPSDKVHRPSCMSSMEEIKRLTNFEFKTPSLPQGYYLECGIIQGPKAIMLFTTDNIASRFDSKSLFDNLGSKIDAGAVYLQVVDETFGQKKSEMSLKEMESKISKIIDNSQNPDIKLRMIEINDVPAVANSRCDDCENGIANFVNETIVTSNGVPARIFFYDDNGISYFLQSNIPLDDLESIAESFS